MCRAARMLALAYLVDRLVDSGELKGYADAARSLGLTRARVTQVVNLLNLSPTIQEALVAGQLDASERRLRELSKSPDWATQQA